MTGGGLRALADIPEIALTEGTRDTSPSHQRNPSDSNLSDLSDSTPEALLCAICLQVLYHPVLWPGGDGDKETCGHSFCRRCVRACLSLTASACCPLCRVPAAANAAECELVVDAAMSARLLREAPAQLAARSRARMRELEVFSSLSELFIYKLDRRYDFKPGYVINLRLREPRHLWLVVKLLESGVRKLGLLMGPESQGTNGMLATVMNLPFRPTSMTLTAALGRVSFERKSKGSVSLKLKVAPEYFRVLRIDHPAPAEEERPWQFIVSCSPGVANSGASAPRLSVAKIVAAKREADLSSAISRTLGGSLPLAAITLSADDSLHNPSMASNDSTSSRSSEPRFGPYFDFGIAPAVIRPPGEPLEL